MMGTRLFVCCVVRLLGIWVALVLLPPAWAGLISVSSEQIQSGFIGYVPAPLYSSDVYSPPVTSLPFDFSGTPYATLESITSVSLTVTIGSGDTAPGDDGVDDLSLRLNGIETGMKLNGFPFGQTATNTVDGVPDQATTILNQLHDTGRLEANIFDRCCAFGDSRKYIVLSIPSINYRWLTDWAWTRATDPANPLTDPDALMLFVGELADQIAAHGGLADRDESANIIAQFLSGIPTAPHGLNDAELMGALGLTGDPVYARLTITGYDAPEPATVALSFFGLAAMAVLYGARRRPGKRFPRHGP